MHARVGPTGDGERVDGAIHQAERAPQLALHRAQARLGRPAAEVGSVVLERQPESHEGTIIAA